MELTEALGCEPLALAQAAAVAGNSTLACRDYRDYFAGRRQQIGMETAGAPAAEVTWTLSWGRRNRCCLARWCGSCWSSSPFSTAAGFPEPSSARHPSPRTSADPLSAFVGGRPETRLGRVADP